MDDDTDTPTPAADATPPAPPDELWGIRREAFGRWAGSGLSVAAYLTRDGAEKASCLFGPIPTAHPVALVGVSPAWRDRAGELSIEAAEAREENDALLERLAAAEQRAGEWERKATSRAMDLAIARSERDELRAEVARLREAVDKADVIARGMLAFQPVSDEIDARLGRMRSLFEVARTASCGHLPSPEDAGRRDAKE